MSVVKYIYIIDKVMFEKSIYMSKESDVSTDSQDVEVDNQQVVEEDTQSSPSDLPPSELFIQLNLAFNRGDIRTARTMLADLDMDDVNEEEKKQIEKLRKQLTFDPVELYLPVVLFVFWAFIFWRTTH